MDVVSYGNDVEHALKMIAEAAAMVIADDLNRGAKPTLRSALKEDWNRLRTLIAHGTPVTPAEFRKSKDPLATNLVLQFRRMSPRPGPDLRAPGKHWEPPRTSERPIAALRAC